MTPDTRPVDVLVVGAGPAGISAALTIADASPASVLIVEAGSHHHRRPCPADQGRSCHGCAGVCNVISGFGGSIHYGDAVKVSHFPAGRRLAELLGDDLLGGLARRAEEVLLPHGADFRRLAADPQDFSGYRLKDYPVATLGTHQVRILLDRLYQRVSDHPQIDTALRHQVTRIEPVAEGFAVEIADPRSGVLLERIRAHQVVLAVGRRGQRWWSAELRRLQLAHRDPTPSVGVRFEMPAELLAPAGQLHPDFKASTLANEVKVKTFCLCAGPGGGRVKFTDYGHHTLLDGHVIPDGDSGAANLALLAQLRDPDGHPRDRAWVDAHLLRPYRALRPDRPGKPVMQWYPDFRDRVLTRTTWPDITDDLTFRPSLRDYGIADLASILPAPLQQALSTTFEDLLRRFSGRQALDPDLLGQVVVAGLELEGLWDELQVSPTMETSLPGLFACGDCAGLAQGILQAAVGGVAAGLGIARTHQAEPVAVSSTP